MTYIWARICHRWRVHRRLEAFASWRFGLHRAWPAIEW